MLAFSQDFWSSPGLFGLPVGVIFFGLLLVRLMQGDQRPQPKEQLLGICFWREGFEAAFGPDRMGVSNGKDAASQARWDARSLGVGRENRSLRPARPTIQNDSG